MLAVAARPAPAAGVHCPALVLNADHRPLQANGVESVLVGSSLYPTFPFEVRGAREQAAESQRLIEEARAAGPAAAEEAERATEPQ